MRHEPRRGVSFGTIFMTIVTVLVLGGSVTVLSRLMGTADLALDVNGMLSTLHLSEELPDLILREIPITDVTEVPDITATPEPVQHTPSPTAAAVPTATPVPGGTVTLTIGGSVNIDDAIRQSAYYSDTGKYDFSDMMQLLRPEMQSDLTLMTLENITYSADKVSSLNAPGAVMEMLANAGVDVLALGFPKAYDKGMPGLSATIEEARAHGLKTIGAYATEREANQLCIRQVNNVDVAFLHYTESISATGKKSISKDGAAYAIPVTLVNGTPDRMLADVRAARAAGADLVVVSLNWGKVSSASPTAAQKSLAQQLADAGADVIVGAGSRVVQPITWMNSRAEDGSIRHTLCAWSLGSLINESRKDGNVVGMLLQLQIYFDGDSLSFEKVCYTPTYLWRFKQDGGYQYRVAVSDQAAPDGMDESQAGFMEKAYRNIQKYLEGSPVTVR